MRFDMTEHGLNTTFAYGNLHISSDEHKGFRPFQLLVSAIVGCSGSVLRKILTKQRIELDYLSIKADVVRNEREANRIEKIVLTYIVASEHITREQMEKNLQIARKNCSMVRSVEDSIEIEEKLQLKE